MIPQLTDEQRQAIDEAGGRGPVSIVDHATSKRYVLLREDVYERLRALLSEEDFDIRETYAAQKQTADQAWSHPDDAAYDHYDAHRDAR